VIGSPRGGANAAPLAPEGRKIHGTLEVRAAINYGNETRTAGIGGSSIENDRTSGTTSPNHLKNPFLG